MPAVHFFQEETRFKLPHPRKSRRWILNAIESENSTAIAINFIFCSDHYLKRINVDYLEHNTLTDVITFDYGTVTEIQGDIFISIERVRDNAKKFQVDLDQEVHRVMIHGVLHLMGYTDKTKSAKALMRKREDAYLSLRR